MSLRAKRSNLIKYSPRIADQLTRFLTLLFEWVIVTHVCLQGIIYYDASLN